MRTTIVAMMAGVCVLAGTRGAMAAPSGGGETRDARTTQRHASGHRKSAGRTGRTQQHRRAHKHANAG